jgi:hypothetical protein
MLINSYALRRLITIKTQPSRLISDNDQQH